MFIEEEKNSWRLFSAFSTCLTLSREGITSKKVNSLSLFHSGDIWYWTHPPMPTPYSILTMWDAGRVFVRCGTPSFRFIPLHRHQCPNQKLKWAPRFHWCVCVCASNSAFHINLDWLMSTPNQRLNPIQSFPRLFISDVFNTYHQEICNQKIIKA